MTSDNLSANPSVSEAISLISQLKIIKNENEIIIDLTDN